MIEILEPIAAFFANHWADILKYIGAFFIWTPLFALLYMVGYHMIVEILEWAPMKRKYDSPVIEQWVDTSKKSRREPNFDPKFSIDDPIVFEEK